MGWLPQPGSCVRSAWAGTSANLPLFVGFASLGLLFGMTLPGAYLMTRKSA